MFVFRLDDDDLDSAARGLARRWGWFLAAGIAGVVVGVILIFNPFTAAATLAALIAIAFAVLGIEQMMDASRYAPRWPAYVLGALYLVGALVVVVWPDITLWVLAVVIGASFVAMGVLELVTVLRFHHQLPYRWLFLLMAGLSIVLGVMAIVWPAATIVVLAVVFGIRVLIYGIGLISFALGLRQIGPPTV